jgi:hypothetical protein
VYHTHNSGDVIRACMHRSYLRRSASGAGRRWNRSVDARNGISTGRCAFWTRFSVGRVIERVQFDLEAVARFSYLPLLADTSETCIVRNLGFLEEIVLATVHLLCCIDHKMFSAAAAGALLLLL